MIRSISSAQYRIRALAFAVVATHAGAIMAHGDHGPGGHDGWVLDHLEFAAWSGSDWLIAGGLLIVAVALAIALVGASRGARRGISRREVPRREVPRRDGH